MVMATHRPSPLSFSSLPPDDSDPPSPTTIRASSQSPLPTRRTRQAPAPLKFSPYPPTPSRTAFSSTFPSAAYLAPGPTTSLSPPLESGNAKGPKQSIPGTVSLDGVPMDYVVDRLHALAHLFWTKPETGDCQIIVPMNSMSTTLARRGSAGGTGAAGRRSPSPSPLTRLASAEPPCHWPPTPSARGFNLEQTSVVSSLDQRRGSEPMPGDRRLTFALHRDYLVTQSTLLRNLFQNSNAIDLLSAPPTAFSSRLDPPRLLPSTSGKPSIYLPLPDPFSFAHIVEFLYFGKPEILERRLAAGHISWDGVVRNTEYLGLPDSVKRVLGRWWRRWVSTRGFVSSSAGGASNKSVRGVGADKPPPRRTTRIPPSAPSSPKGTPLTLGSSKLTPTSAVREEEDELTAGFKAL